MCTQNLNEIIISKENKMFSYADEKHKIIIGKTNKNNIFFDNLVFSCRDIQYIIIPFYIEHICSSSFYECKKLTKMEFPNNSKLKSIGSNAFACSNI